MDFLNKYNNDTFFDFETPETHEYKSLRDLYNKDIDNTYTIRAIFINTKSKFGDHPVAVTDNELINLPQHLLKNCQDMINDNEAVHHINEGDVGIEIYEYMSSKYGKQHSVKFVAV